MRYVRAPYIEGRTYTEAFDFEIRDAAGRCLAIHRRFNYTLPDGTRDKDFRWYQPDGSGGLGGRRMVELPLYNLEGLLTPDPDETVILTEGEKACEALRARGFLAVASATGARTTPSENTLTALLPFSVYLWPDNDPEGQSHMQRVGQRLLALGARPRLINWPEAPGHGDAADYLGDVRFLLEQSMPMGSVLEQLGPAHDPEATRERLLQNDDDLRSFLKQSFRDCHQRWRVYRCPQDGRKAKRFNCGLQSCPYCGPRCLRRDWDKQIATGARFRVYTVTSDQVETIADMRRLITNAMKVAKRQVDKPTITYGVRLTKGLKPMALVAEHVDGPEIESPAFDKHFLGEATSEEVRDWLDWHYQDELATAWSNSDELRLLLWQTRGRKRFQCAGPGWKRSELSLNAKQGDMSDRPPSGGSGKRGAEKGAPACPVCGQPMERDLDFYVMHDDVLDEIPGTEWFDVKPRPYEARRKR